MEDERRRIQQERHRLEQEAMLSMCLENRLDKAMQGYVDRREVGGCVCLVARHGKVVYHKSFGYRDVEAEARM